MPAVLIRVLFARMICRLRLVSMPASLQCATMLLAANPSVKSNAHFLSLQKPASTPPAPHDKPTRLPSWEIWLDVQMIKLRSMRPRDPAPFMKIP